MPSSFTLGAHFEGFIRRQVSGGRYASASEVVRDGLRLLEEQDALRQARLDALRAEIDHGVESGAGIPGDRVFASVRQQIADTERAKNA